MNQIETLHSDTLGNQLATAAITTLTRLCPEIRTASNDLREAALGAMRAKSEEVADKLIDATFQTPWAAGDALDAAALTLATEGVKVIRGN